jgi:hypothetical protein
VVERVGRVLYTSGRQGRPIVTSLSLSNFPPSPMYKTLSTLSFPLFLIMCREAELMSHFFRSQIHVCRLGESIWT